MHNLILLQLKERKKRVNNSEIDKNCEMRTNILGYLILTFQTYSVLAGDNFEFQLSGPMLITSIRIFEQISDAYVSQSRSGSVFLKADENYGIMAVVQTTNLEDSQDSICHDFVKISRVGADNTASTSQICGNISNTEPKRPSFVDKSGFTELVYVLNNKYRTTQLDTNVTNFNISFTPFTECPEPTFPFGNTFLRPCSLVDSFSCISANYFCDGVINCAFPEEVGLDEQNCEPAKNINIAKVESKPEIGLKGQAPIRPYDPYITVNETEIQSLNKVHLSSSANFPVGIVAIIIIFIALFILSKSNRSNQLKIGRDTETKFDKMDTEVDGYNVELILHHDLESDTPPSYEECLLTSRSTQLCSELTSESECPSAYMERLRS